MTRDSLEQELLADSKFQHILKLAPQSQRELMTFELANYFYRYTAEKVLEARKDELEKSHYAHKETTLYFNSLLPYKSFNEYLEQRNRVLSDELIALEET